MKVLLIIPKREYLFNQKAFPHLGVLQVSSALKSAGHDVIVLDFSDGYKYIRADWYGISCTTSDWDEALKTRDFIKSYDKNAKIMIGGAHATYNHEECQKEFEYVAAGDGEISALEIINANKNYSFGYMLDIDKFHPDRTAVNLQEYEFYVDGKRATSLITGLSCAYGKCSFCSRPPQPFYNVPRYHSSEWCRQEIEEISKLDFKAIMIYDDEFLTNKIRDQKIIYYLHKYGITSWRCFLRSDYALKNRDLLYYASKNGLKEVLIGIESGSNTILKAINKGTTVEQNTEVIDKLWRLGIKVKCAMIIGLPSESKETLKETIDWCDQVKDKVTDWDFTICTPLPGSDIYNNKEKYDINFDKERVHVAYKSMNSGFPILNISTSSLSFEEIIRYREILEKMFKLKKEVSL